MNNSYKLVYSETLNAWVAVSEHVSARGKKGTVRLLTALAMLAAGASPSGMALAAPPAPAANQLPTGAQVAAGTVQISQTQTATAASMSIQQSSQQAIVNWQSFNVGAAAKVNISQPGSSSVLLNRVLDTNPSQIFGQIQSNGQVFLTNPNGVYFAPGSSVDVGSFAATTHSITDSDFLKGNYSFSRNGATGSIVNQGSITAGLGGYIALLAPEVINQGVVVAQVGGTVAMAAGDSFELQFNQHDQLSNVLVSPGTLNTLVENGNAVRAPGGLIILSAQAASNLLGGVVRNNGTLSATGLVDNGGVIRLSAGNRIELSPQSRITADAAADSAGKGGRIEAIADLGNPDSTNQVNGALSAKGGQLGGDGGFIETSGSTLRIADQTLVSTWAPQGQSGTWLLDPTDFTIAASGGDMTGSLLSSNLGSTDITISAGTGAAGTLGNINILDAVNWTSHALTLNAGYHINVGTTAATGSLTVTGTGSLALNPSSALVAGNTAGGAVLMGMASSPSAGLTSGYLNSGSFVSGNAAGFNGQINVAGSATVKIAGTAYTVINSESAFVGMAASGKYVLGSNLGFGTAYTNTVVSSFSGTLNAFGHQISGLNIVSSANNAALFGGSTGTISNLGISGTVSGTNQAASLVGTMTAGSIRRTYSSANVTGTTIAGGLIGLQQGGSTILSESYTTGNVFASTQSAGGLDGYLYGGLIDSSYSTGNISGKANLGGLVGSVQLNSIVSNSYATGNVTGTIAGANNNFGGLFGFSVIGSSIQFTNNYSTGTVSGAATNAVFGGIIGIAGSGNIFSGNYWNKTKNPSLNPTTGGVGSGTGTTTSLTSTQMLSASNVSNFGIASGAFTAASGWGYQVGLNGNFPIRCAISLCTSKDTALVAVSYTGPSGGSWSTASNWAITGTGASISYAPTAAYDYTLSNVTIGSGTTVNYDTANTGSISSTISNAGAIALSGASNVLLSGVVSGAGSILQAGSGTLTLSASNSYSGGTTVSSGTIKVSSAAGLGSGAVTLGSSGTLDLSYAGTVSLGSTLNMAAGSSITNSTASSNLSVTGAGTLAGSVTTLGTQTYGGAVTLGGATTLTTTNAAVSFSSPINGAYDLTINNGSGNVQFGSTVGTTTALSSLAITGGSTATAQTTTLGGDVTTSGIQTYGGNLTLGSNSALTTSNAAVTIAGNINTSAFNVDMYLEANGAYIFGGTTYAGTASTPITLAGLGTLTYVGAASNQSTFSFTPSASLSTNFIVVGGGGGGGDDGGGGGGGGGVVTNSGGLLPAYALVSGTAYTMVIGNGGATNQRGYNSTAFGYTALGGGSGGRGTTGNCCSLADTNANTGGSGGGHRAYSNGGTAASTQFSSFGYGTGNASGTDLGGSGLTQATGGGGAGGAGFNTSTGNGGAAYLWTDGHSYAGGGAAPTLEAIPQLVWVGPLLSLRLREERAMAVWLLVSLETMLSVALVAAEVAALTTAAEVLLAVAEW